jgi:hypothetical protein
MEISLWQSIKFQKIIRTQNHNKMVFCSYFLGHNEISFYEIKNDFFVHVSQLTTIIPSMKPNKTQKKFRIQKINQKIKKKDDFLAAHNKISFMKKH